MTRRPARSFFLRPTLEVARRLLGMKLVTQTDAGRRTSGIIVETEAYHGEHDEAAHSFGRKTPRNEIMFGRGGCCYVYFIYGMHHCVNVVTEDEGIGAAVLIRAIEPLEGIETMRRRRKVSATALLANGPGKICSALRIDRRMLGEDLTVSRKIWIEKHIEIPGRHVLTTPRIGISKSIDLPWRFLVDGPTRAAISR